MKKEEIRAQVRRIVGSAELESSPRLQDFLKYIVEEALAGRSDRIKGLTIAQAVFGADESFDPESNSIVRVEAGRLRRRLKEYYQTTGREDSVVLDVPKGSYAPVFKVNPGLSNSAPSPQAIGETYESSGKTWLFVALLFVIVILTGWFWQTSNTVIETQNRFEAPAQSDATEAEILFDQAFVILMPPGDGARLNAAVDLFRHVVELDSDFAGGYVGESLAHSFKVLFLKSTDKQADLAQAKMLAETAVELDPDYSLAYSALSLSQSLDSNHESALRNARHSLAYQPRSPTVNAMASLVLLNAGKPEDTIALLFDALRSHPEEPRTPYLNILAIAQYLTSDFKAAAKSMESNLARNGPTGPHMDVFLAATYTKLGKDFEAQAIIERLQRTHPDYPVESWLRNYIKSEDDLHETMKKFWSLGLSKP